MINYLSRKSDIIEGVMVWFFIFDLALIIAFYFYNKPRYKKIISLYEKEIGPIPFASQLSSEASLFTTPSLYLAKVSFILETLIFPYNRVSNHGMTKEGYLFIRGLPKKLTIGFKIEACLWIFCIPVLVYLFIIR